MDLKARLYLFSPEKGKVNKTQFEILATDYFKIESGLSGTPL